MSYAHIEYTILRFCETTRYLAEHNLGALSLFIKLCDGNSIIQHTENDGKNIIDFMEIVPPSLNGHAKCIDALTASLSM